MNLMKFKSVFLISVLIAIVNTAFSASTDDHYKRIEDEKSALNTNFKKYGTLSAAVNLDDATCFSQVLFALLAM